MCTASCCVLRGTMRALPLEPGLEPLEPGAVPNLREYDETQPASGGMPAGAPGRPSCSRSCAGCARSWWPDWACEGRLLVCVVVVAGLLPHAHPPATRFRVSSPFANRSGRPEGGNWSSSTGHTRTKPFSVRTPHPLGDRIDPPFPPSRTSARTRNNRKRKSICVRSRGDAAGRAAAICRAAGSLWGSPWDPLPVLNLPPKASQSLAARAPCAFRPSGRQPGQACRGTGA